MEEHQNLFKLQKQARESGNWQQSLAILDDMHRQYHDRAWIHVNVHVESAKTCFSARRWSGTLFHLAVIVFAPPASWAQHYLGLARNLDK